VSIIQPIQILGLARIAILTVTGHGSAVAEHGVTGPGK